MKKKVFIPIIIIIILLFIGGAVLVWVLPDRLKKADIHTGGVSSKTQFPSPLDFTPKIAQLAMPMVRSLQLPEAEQKAVDEAIQKKVAAREMLQRKVFSLYELAVNERAAEAELAQAVNEYLEAKKNFQQAIQKADDELVASVSTRTKARLIASGIIDNGLGFMAGKPLSTAGMPRPEAEYSNPNIPSNIPSGVK